MAFRDPTAQNTETDDEDQNQISAPPSANKRAVLIAKVVPLVRFLESAKLDDRANSKRAIREISDLAVNAVDVNVIIQAGFIPALVKQLRAAPLSDCVQECEHDVETEIAKALLCIAVEPHKQLIVDSGALTHLVDLLKSHKNGLASSATNRLIHVAVKAIELLADGSNTIQTSVRIEGGIPPLVHFLQQAEDKKVQTAAASAVKALSFKNAQNTNEIVGCNAIPTLILMLRSKDASIHWAALDAIGSLMQLSNTILSHVLLSGAIQPVIELLSSCCSESQSTAALILFKFAATHPNCKIQIVQRGAVPPLVKMLQSPEEKVRNISASLLGKLALNKHNQAGIVHNGGLVELLKLLDSKEESLQHSAIVALYHLADNEDNVYNFITVGGVQRLQEGGFIDEADKDLVAKTLTRLEEKIHGHVLNQLIYLMRDAEKRSRIQIALALAHFCSSTDSRSIFIDHHGFELLIELLGSSHSKQQLDGAVALCKLANKALTLSSVDTAPPSPTPHVNFGESFLNNAALSDVTFSVEGKQFYAHRTRLIASSDIFRAMLCGGFRERDAKDIKIPDIKWTVFESMMRFIYTGSVDVTQDIAQDLLKASNQYILEGLKVVCENTIARKLLVENVHSIYDFSEDFNAATLRDACILFILEHFQELSARDSVFVDHIIPEIHLYLLKLLQRPTPISV